VCILLWSLYAFAGVYAWTIVPLAIGATALTAHVRPRVGRAPHRVLDAALIGWLMLAALQLVPLSPTIRATLSPAALAVDRQIRLAGPGDPLSAPPRPLSLDPAGSVWALTVGISAALLFWCARELVARHSPRILLRSIAVAGLLVSAIAIVQHATAPKLLYWYWHPIARSASPFSPFVNRNDLATWLIMAIPLTIGYGVARWMASRRSNAQQPDIPSLVDDTLLWLGASVCLMLAALLVSMSRSGLTSGALGLMAFAWLSGGRTARRERVWLALALVTVVVLAATYANVGMLAKRIDETMAEGLGGRDAIWRETWTMVRDFWLTGVGVGAYERGMTVYQQSPRIFYFNHAHNEYLQLLAEGGLMLAFPAAIALLAGATAAARALRRDRSSFFWIRAGAVGGLLAVAVQAIWDTGLARPANTTLFAVLAAIATFSPVASRGAGSRRGAKPLRHSADDSMEVREREEDGWPRRIDGSDVTDWRE
jgi:O-antigen ligase